MLASVNSTYTDIVTSVFSSAIAGKVWFASLAIFFALIQIVTATRIYGKLRGVLPGSVFGVPVATIHRWSGRIAFLCTLPVAFHSALTDEDAVEGDRQGAEERHPARPAVDPPDREPEERRGDEARELAEDAGRGDDLDQREERQLQLANHAFAAIVVLKTDVTMSV